jgi:hypothetical protein
MLNCLNSIIAATPVAAVRHAMVTEVLFEGI